MTNCFCAPTSVILVFISRVANKHHLVSAENPLQTLFDLCQNQKNDICKRYSSLSQLHEQDAVSKLNSILDHSKYLSTNVNYDLVNVSIGTGCAHLPASL